MLSDRTRLRHDVVSDDLVDDDDDGRPHDRCSGGDDGPACWDGEWALREWMVQLR
jgi:hypothetical protein